MVSRDSSALGHLKVASKKTKNKQTNKQPKQKTESVDWKWDSKWTFNFSLVK